MKYQIYKKDREWRWRLIAINGEVLASGEGYGRKRDCLHAIGLVKAAAKDIWLRRDDETAKAYAAASLYFEMGAKRSLEAAAQKCIKNVSLLRRWSVKHQWLKRAKAYDAHLDAIAQKAIDKTAEKGAIDWQKERNRIRMEALQNSKLLVRKAIAMLNFPLVTKRVRGGITIVEPVRWSMTDAVKFVETADKLQRLAAEMETSNDKLTIVDQDAEKREVRITALMDELNCSREAAEQSFARVEKAKEKVGGGYVN